MNLTEEIEAILNSPAHGADTYKSSFWRLTEITEEMAKRIEGLEKRLAETKDEWLQEGEW